MATSPLKIPQKYYCYCYVLNEAYLIFILQHYLCNKIQGYFIDLCSPMKYPIVLTVLEQWGQWDNHLIRCLESFQLWGCPPSLNPIIESCLYNKDISFLRSCLHISPIDQWESVIFVYISFSTSILCKQLPVWKISKKNQPPSNKQSNIYSCTLICIILDNPQGPYT